MDLLQGHVSPALFSPALLRPALRQIKFRLTYGLSLPYDPDEDLMEYYRLFRAHVTPANYGFLVTLTIPLFDSTSSYNVYSIRHIPIFLQSAESCFSISHRFNFVYMKNYIFA